MREILPRCPVNFSGELIPTVLKNVSKLGSNSNSVTAALETTDAAILVPSGNVKEDVLGDDDDDEEDEDVVEEVEVVDEELVELEEEEDEQQNSFQRVATCNAPKCI